MRMILASFRYAKNLRKQKLALRKRRGRGIGPQGRPFSRLLVGKRVGTPFSRRGGGVARRVPFSSKSGRGGGTRGGPVSRSCSTHCGVNVRVEATPRRAGARPPRPARAPRPAPATAVRARPRRPRPPSTPRALCATLRIMANGTLFACDLRSRILSRTCDTSILYKRTAKLPLRRTVYV